MNGIRLLKLLGIAMDTEQAIYLVQPESRQQLKPEAILFSEWLERIDYE
jgi:hypothetical protein